MVKRKCKLESCGERIEKSEGVIVGLSFYCCYEHAAKDGLAKVEKQRKAQRKKAAADTKKAEKAARKRHRQQKEDLKTVSQLTKEAEYEVRRYVRARDKPKRLPCPSCLKPFDQVEAEQRWKTGGAWDAGHYRSKGAAPQHRFNVLNIHLQCKSCNSGESKNRAKEITVQQQFRKTLISRIGINVIESLENNNLTKKFDKDYLRRVRDIFRKRANRFEKINKKTLPTKLQGG